METEELLGIVANGEDSRHQFKANIRHAESLAQEMVAFSNSEGGMILIGVTDDGDIAELTSDDMRRLNQLVSNAATDHVRPPISPTTQNIALPDGLVMVVSVAEGISKPYMDKNLHVYVKSGADKRKVTAREEMLRIYQEVALVHADSIPVKGTSSADIDQEFFATFFENEFGERVDEQDVPLSRLLENMNLSKQGQLNLCGTLLFALRPQNRLPVFHVKAVAFPGEDITDEHYIDSQDVKGRLSDIFQKTLGVCIGKYPICAE